MGHITRRFTSVWDVASNLAVVMIASLAVSIPMNRLSTVCSKLSRRALVFGPLHEFLTLIRTRLCLCLSVLRNIAKGWVSNWLKITLWMNASWMNYGPLLKKGSTSLSTWEIGSHLWWSMGLDRLWPTPQSSHLLRGGTPHSGQCQ